MLTWFMTSEEGAAGSGLTGHCQEQQKVSIGGNQIISYSRDRSKQNGDFLWAYTTTWWEFESRGAKQKAVATFPKSRSVLGQIYKVPLGGY